MAKKHLLNPYFTREKDAWDIWCAMVENWLTWGMPTWVARIMHWGSKIKWEALRKVIFPYPIIIPWCALTPIETSRQQTLSLLGPMLQSPASLAVDHSFICITNWGATWVYSSQNISCIRMCGEIRQWSWIFAWHHSSLLGSHILYDCICLLSNKIPAPSSLWKWSIALSTSLTGPGTFQQVSHTAFFC